MKRKRIYALADGYGLDYYMDASIMKRGSVGVMKAKAINKNVVFFYAEISEQTDKKIKKILGQEWEGCIEKYGEKASIEALKLLKKRVLKFRIIGGSKLIWDKIPYEKRGG